MNPGAFATEVHRHAGTGRVRWENGGLDCGLLRYERPDRNGVYHPVGPRGAWLRVGSHFLWIAPWWWKDGTVRRWIGDKVRSAVGAQ
jgi:hypothetical protein